MESHIYGVDQLDYVYICFAVFFVEFGFFNMSFTGIERGEAQVVEVGTISGTLPGMFSVTISLQRITAGRITCGMLLALEHDHMTCN